ncbi:hypothetical protein B0F90DRAFT_1739447 [Multifurca ochricompacta]|uniref:NAD(P)-binding domain-containing protein n=1 Tax=Multifurca ochricompacta TaxID=376703 RepID=A0AAD4QLX2_9AGAM|nr:hypothetical protein B0F90DRAFT_1739447 [Multifurca ochricompacta]
MSSSASPKSALILGATGQTGLHLLRELIASPTFTRVCEAGRRVTPKEDLPDLGENGNDKFEQKVIDFERLEEAELKEGNWDVVFITLGTTLKLAGSQENFTKIDKEYVVNAAKAAKVDKDQRLVYLSVVMADPKSRNFYPRSKGLTEQALAELGYKDTIVFRPGMLSNVQRAERRFSESIALGVTGILSWVSPRFQIDVRNAPPPSFPQRTQNVWLIALFFLRLTSSPKVFALPASKEPRGFQLVHRRRR